MNITELFEYTPLAAENAADERLYTGFAMSARGRRYAFSVDRNGQVLCVKTLPDGRWFTVAAPRGLADAARDALRKRKLLIPLEAARP